MSVRLINLPSPRSDSAAHGLVAGQVKNRRFNRYDVSNTSQVDMMIIACQAKQPTLELCYAERVRWWITLGRFPFDVLCDAVQIVLLQSEDIRLESIENEASRIWLNILQEKENMSSTPTSTDGPDVADGKCLTSVTTTSVANADALEGIVTTITLTIPPGAENEINRIVKRDDAFFVISDFCTWLRNQLKYGNDERMTLGIEAAHTAFWDLCKHRGIDPWEY